jgi:voltage-gated potassium channel Kch
MRRITLADRLRYEFDNLMSRGAVALVATLLLVTLMMIVSISTLLYLFDLELRNSADGISFSFGRILWTVFNHTIDPGSLENTKGDLLYLGGLFLATMGGTFIVSALIGIIATGFENKLAELRKGDSFVVESGHTLILGWSPAIFTVIRQLILAKAHRPRSAIVILAEQDKVEMEDEIRVKVGRTGRTRIICRTGNPSDFDDLAIVNPNNAGLMLVMPSENLDGDVRVIKILLALVQNPQRRPEPYYIITQLYDEKNRAIARMVGKDEVIAFRLGGILGFVLVESVRQVRLSRVLTQLIRYEGGEIYFHEEPTLVGKTFGDILSVYETCSVIGLRLPNGDVVVNPPQEKAIAPKTQIIAIAEDEKSFHCSTHPNHTIDRSALRTPQPHVSQPLHLLILGWNEDAPDVIARLDRYMAAGSSVLLVAHDPETPAKLDALRQQMQHLHLECRLGDIQDRRLLDALDVPTYDRVVVLSPFDRLTAELADAETLIVLLHLRDISDQSGRRFPIISQLMKESNRNLARVAQADDVIVSNQLVSLVLAQMSQNRDRLPAIQGLTDPDGNHLQLRLAEDYVALGHPVNFYTVVESAKRFGHLVIGYCVEAEAKDESSDYGVRLNPKKSDSVTFVEGDRLIVVAQDEPDS